MARWVSLSLHQPLESINSWESAAGERRNEDDIQVRRILTLRGFPRHHTVASEVAIPRGQDAPIDKNKEGGNLKIRTIRGHLYHEAAKSKTIEHDLSDKRYAVK